jgi:hypothetical protein
MAVFPTRSTIFLRFLYHFPPFFQKSKTRLNIPGSRRMTWSKFHTEDPQTLGAAIKKNSRSVRECGHMTVKSLAYILQHMPFHNVALLTRFAMHYTTVFELVFGPVICWAMNRTNSESNLHVPVTCGGYLTSRSQQPSTRAAVTYEATRLYLQNDRQRMWYTRRSTTDLT